MVPPAPCTMSGATAEAEEVGGGRRRGTTRRKVGPRPERVPATWAEEVGVAAATVRFTWEQTMGKWGFCALAFGIRDYMHRHQDNDQFTRTYSSSGCKQLKGAEITAKLIHLLSLLNICLMFTKKSFPLFLESSGYSSEDVIVEEHKAGVLKPNFAVICDRTSKCLFLFVRGARTIKDKLTATIGEMVPFHHLILHEGQVDNVILGYAHCGMVTAARWIARRTTHHLLQAVRQNPDFKIKIVGHSMGAGIASILTYILREHEEFSSTTCIAFAPASCMTWDLAESGKHFITSIVNCTDLVPTFSPASVSDLHSEIRAASQAKDSRKEDPCTGVNVVSHSASAVQSCMESVCCGGVAIPINDQNVDNTTDNLSTCFSSFSWLGLRQHVISKKISDSIVVESSGEDAEVDLLYPLASNYKAVGEGDLISIDHAANEVARCSIALETNDRVGEASRNKLHCLSDALERHEYYPPGKMMHMVTLPASHIFAEMSNEEIGIFETPRELYGKIRLAETMIRDHYMPRYIERLGQVIDCLRKDCDLPSSSPHNPLHSP